MLSLSRGGSGRFTRTALAAVLVLGPVVSVGAGRAAAGAAPTSGTEVHAAAAPLVGYRMAASNGASYTFSSAGVTVTGPMALHRPVVGMASTPDGGGYWLVASDGGIFSFGDASFHGSTGGINLVRPVVGMASTPDGGGYWLVASDGGIFSYGDARFHGSTGGIRLARPIVGMAATPDGGGYWLVASDGGIFAFGDARFYGSTGGIRLNRPIVGMTSSPDGHGYWMAASDGGIFAFGDASFHGSTGGINLARPVVGIQSTPDGGGYWLVASDGGVFNYGDAPFYGTPGSSAAPVVGISRPDGMVLPPVTPHSGAEFSHPSGLALAGGYLWVANQTGNSLTQIRPVNPAGWVATYSGSSYGFSSPSAIIAYGNDVFVANAGGSVTEVSAVNGSPVRVISGAAYGFADPTALALSGTTLLVLNAGLFGGAGSITEINADTGALIRVVSGAAYSFDDPLALTVDGSDVYVADKGSNSVTDVVIGSGALVGVITGGGLSGPDGAAAGSGYVWVANSGNATMTRITAGPDTTQNFSNPNYGLWDPSAVAEASGYVYVLTPFGTSPMISKIDEVGGAGPWYMCNTNGPYYFSNLTSLAIGAGEIWVASANGANNPKPAAANGSLTELNAGDGGLVQTVP